MKQRVVVQAIIKENNQVLLLRRSQGRPGIVGKYELPGGTIDDKEQPDDALKRHLRNDAGISTCVLSLYDVVSLQNREEGDIQHVLIVYSVSGIDYNSAIHVGRSYDEFAWVKLSEIQQNSLRDSAFSLLSLYISPKDQQTTDNTYTPTSDARTLIYSDGGSRGNPGPSAAAFLIMDQNQHIIDQGGNYLGITTNNQAEYQGVLMGLERAAELGIPSVEFRVDSMLVVNQLKGIYKIKNRELWPIYERIRELLLRFEHISFTHVPRELNQLADGLVNRTLDDHKNDLIS